MFDRVPSASHAFCKSHARNREMALVTKTEDKFSFTISDIIALKKRTIYFHRFHIFIALASVSRIYWYTNERIKLDWTYLNSCDVCVAPSAQTARCHPSLLATGPLCPWFSSDRHLILFVSSYHHKNLC